MTTPRPQPSPDPSAPYPEPFAARDLRPPLRPRDDAEFWLYGLERLGIRPGLERVHALLTAIGEPHLRVPCFVVAGTNGKGTVTHLLGDRLRDMGLRVGVYTSPHLLDICERAVIDGPLPRSELAARVARLRPHVERLGATFFETFTALSLGWFADEGVDMAVLEVGVGGRWDATNVARKQALFLCSVGLDHQELLGPTLTHIAREKLALCEPGVPFYLAPLASDLRRLARQEIEERQGVAIDVSSLPPCPHEVERAAAFLGSSQRELSRFVDRCLFDLAARGALRFDPQRLRAGRVPARLERYGERPPLLIDPAHNEPALRRLVEAAASGGSDDVLVFASMRDKRVDAVLPLLHGLGGHILVTAPHWHRSRPVSELATALMAAGSAPVEGHALVVDALERARILAAGSGRVLVTGSNFLLAEALDRLGVDDLFAAPAAPLWDSGAPLRRREGETS